MPIIDPTRKENLKYNYGVVFKHLLKSYSVQTKFYDEEIPINKNKWFSTCKGNVYFPEVDKLYEKTGIDKDILNGFRKFKISTLVSKDMPDELDRVITLLKNNPQEFESNSINGDYDKNFVRLIHYVLSIANKINSNIEDKFNDIIKQLNTITSRDYISVDTVVLEKYREALKEHLDIAVAAATIKNFKK